MAKNSNEKRLHTSNTFPHFCNLHHGVDFYRYIGKDRLALVTLDMSLQSCFSQPTTGRRTLFAFSRYGISFMLSCFRILL